MALASNANTKSFAQTQCSTNTVAVAVAASQYAKLLQASETSAKNLANSALYSASKAFTRKRMHFLKMVVLGSTLLTTLASLFMYKKSRTRASQSNTAVVKSTPAVAASAVPFSHKHQHTVVHYKMVDDDVFKVGDIRSKLVNSAPAYIETRNIENLLSVPRYQYALMCIKRANSRPTQANYETVFHELVKLGDSPSQTWV